MKISPKDPGCTGSEAIQNGDAKSSQISGPRDINLTGAPSSTFHPLFRDCNLEVKSWQFCALFLSYEFSFLSSLLRKRTAHRQQFHARELNQWCRCRWDMVQEQHCDDVEHPTAWYRMFGSGHLWQRLGCFEIRVTLCLALSTPGFYFFMDKSSS